MLACLKYPSTMSLNREQLKHPKSELRSAERAITRMKESKNFSEFENAWKDFLTTLEKVWIKTERVCQEVRNKFQPWQGYYKKIRRKDLLLRYLKHARNADHHTIQEGIKHTPGRTTFNPAHGNSWHIDKLVITNGKVTEYSGDKPMRVEHYPSKIELLKVEDSGNWYKPPKKHNGERIPLKNRNPISISELGLKFYEGFVKECEDEFFEDNPAG
jgi:hypothetical protein